MGATIISEASTGTAVRRTNLIANPSFEVNTTGWSNGGTSFTRVTSDSYSGSACGQLVTASILQSAFITTSGLAASTTYTASVWVKGEAGKSARLDIRELTAGGAQVADTNGVNTLMTGLWQRLTVTRTLGPTGAQIAIFVRNGTSAAHTLLVDAAMLEVAASATSYFDGASAAVDDFSYAWTGTANASTSIETETLYDEILPELVMSTQSGRDLRTVIVNVPGSSTPYVSLEASGLRTGTLELFFGQDEDAAYQAEAIIAAGGVFFLDYPERESWEMRFIPVGRLERALDQETRDHWTVSFDYQELAA